MGHRSVPVEVGHHYLDKDNHTKFIKFYSFIENYILKNDPNGYLAQFDLLSHIKELENDIEIPDMCSFFNEKIGKYLYLFYFIYYMLT